MWHTLRLLAAGLATCAAYSFYVPLSPNADVPDAKHVATTNQFNAQRLLDVTNALRVAHGLSVVAWNPELSAKLQAFANSCPGFVHGGPTGFQNLAGNFESCASSASCWGDRTGAWQWYGEVAKWDFKAQKCATGSWSDCGHFSNMMSPSITDMGCAMSYCPSINKYYNVWCNYNGAVVNPVVPTSKYNLETLQAALKNQSHELWTALRLATPP
ncbi:hypothetical protein SPRG_12910 [Saprolegnia parasitica CBS 223.65]|uniref:SCP domain-containing protein n=1 Tax=Saprolegnia parasitica (strain CBS 223.65) TaxID=695850 RepID=A0A067BRK8_SAPPC|nr:hypothetical protein SPRG_12910 [Saprolegnia parasitica CBS 223.65]KDO21129.1 hypothetical protein SPRG_12910 [Saprolegnia parasitica CBS 223.65]|eukprot:XP_012208130.1 hypothetical protein SPRG_12910 [Saprolegnia parasitica CBS 223.65]